MTDIQQAVQQQMPTHDETPEAVSVLVVTDDEEVALIVAPLLAKRLYPTRQFGDVMFAEPMEGGYEVVVKVQERFDPSIISHIQNNR